MPRLDSGSLTPIHRSGDAVSAASSDAAAAAAGGGTEEPTPETWVPPVWLLGDTTSSKRPHGRVFKLGVGNSKTNAVPAAIRNAIIQHVVKQRQQQQVPGGGDDDDRQEPPEREEHKARLLRAKYQEQVRKQQAASQRVTAVQEAKAGALQEIRVRRRQESQRVLQQTEDSMRSAFEKEQEEKDHAWRQRVQEECAQDKKRALDELEDQERREDEQAAVAKKAKLEAAAVLEKEAAAAEEAAHNEIAALQKEVETMNHNRLEIVWLLKRVIKAEEKQKAMIQAKLQARPVAPKQA